MNHSVVKELERSYLRGEYGRVVVAADELLNDPVFSDHRPWLLFWKGTALVMSGAAWRGEAMACYREGIQSSGNNREIKTRHMAGLAKVYSDSGDCEALERLLPRFERTIRRQGPGVEVWLTHVLQNYGVALMNAFRDEEAVDTLRRAMTLARRYGLNEMEGRCAHDLACAELALCRLPEAATAMSIARVLFPDEYWGHKKRGVEAQYLLALGDVTGALQAIQASLTHPRMDDETRGAVYLVWAQALLAQGETVGAREKAGQALDFAVRARCLPTIHRSTRFLKENGGLRLLG